MKRINKNQSQKPNNIKGLTIELGPLSFKADSLPVAAWWGLLIVLILIVVGLLYL